MLFICFIYWEIVSCTFCLPQSRLWIEKKDVWRKVFYIGVSAFALYALNSNASREKNAVSFFEYITRFLTDSYPEVDMIVRSRLKRMIF